MTWYWQPLTELQCDVGSRAMLGEMAALPHINKQLLIIVHSGGQKWVPGKVERWGLGAPAAVHWTLPVAFQENAEFQPFWEIPHSGTVIYISFNQEPIS